VQATIEPALLDTPEACVYLGIGRTTLFALVSQHKLHTVRVGRCLRFPKADLDGFIQRLQDEQAQPDGASRR
jgi:excisionase family DNA binding protein